MGIQVLVEQSDWAEDIWRVLLIMRGVGVWALKVGGHSGSQNLLENR